MFWMQAKVDEGVEVGNEAAMPWARMPWSVRAGIVGAFLAFVGCSVAFVWPFFAWWGRTFVQVYVQHRAPEEMPSWPYGAWWLLVGMVLAGAATVVLTKPYWVEEDAS